MNRMLQFLIFIFWGTFLYSQNIVIDGVIFSADGKTLIEYPKDKADKKYVIPEGTEVIGIEAFNNADLLCHVTLPSTLKEIRDNAFFYCSSLKSVTWANFPLVIGRDIFYKSPICEFYVSDGANCIVENNVLFSVDRKILLRYPPARQVTQDEFQGAGYSTGYVIPEGTQVINKLAFERAFLYDVTLPSSLKTIEKGAFWVKARIPVRSSESLTYNENDFDWDLEYRNMDMVVCNATVPPVLIGEPFANPYWTQLYVPEESFDSYCYAGGWTKFKHINDKSNPASINDISSLHLKVISDGNNLHVKSPQKISEVRLYTLSGVLLVSKVVNNDVCSIELDDLLQGLLLLEVVYEDGVSEKIKFYK